MKKTLLLIASVAMTMAACTNDVAEPDYGNIVNPGEVAISASSNGTRTSMSPNAAGGLDIAWVGGEDQIGIFANDEGALAYTNAAYTAVESGSYTAFSANDTRIQWGTGEHNFYAYYPYTTASDLHQTAVSASIPAVQTQSADGNMDHLQPLAFMYAVQEGAVQSAGGIDFSFVNAFSVLEVKLCAAEGTVDCEAVIFRAVDETEVVSASNVMVNLTNGSLDYSSAEATNEIRVNLESPIELNTETPAAVYAMITPGHGGKQFKAIAVVGGQEVELGEMGVPESGIPAGKIAKLSLNVTAPEEDTAIDLSANGTSNCYIVNAAATEYKFKATVKGNGYAPMAGETAEIAPTKARILWAQAGYKMDEGDADDDWPSNLGNTGAVDLIDYTTVELKDGYVRFTTGENMGNGNVVIAATDDAGNILWSWHMWILNGYDVAAEDYYVTASDLNYYMMDRNLGATATPKNGVETNNEWVGARGYFYQWGRKDPFIGHSIKWNGYEAQALVYDAEGNPTVDEEGKVAPQYVNYDDSQIFPRISASDIPNAGDVYASVAYAVANPMSYLSGGASYMWTAGNDAAVVSGATNEWGKLWGNQAESYSSWDKGGVKTMYDPCPAGYRVPSVGHFRFITSHGDNAGAHYNHNRNWRYNTKENVFASELAADATSYAPVYENHGQGCPPYGFNFYVKGSKTGTKASEETTQDNGIAPEDATTAYFPAQGLFRWNGDEKTSGGDLNVVMHTNAVKNAEYYGYSTFLMYATAKGEFFNNAGTISWGEQQAKALPVRCVRESAE